MKVLALGCGEMGQTAIRDLFEYGDFDEIVIGDIDLAKAERVAKELKGKKKTKVSAKSINVADREKLVGLMQGSDAVLSCVGPFYKFALDVAKAAIEAKVNLVDICDDYDLTSKVLELDQEAKRAGITIISGLGASPGLTNLLAKAGASELDSTEEIHTAFVLGGSDPGGLSEMAHRFHSMYGKVPTFKDGKYVEVQAFVDGKEELDFAPPFGKFEVFHVGHPEPITLPKYIKGVRYVDCKGSTNPPLVKDVVLKLGDMGLFSEEPLNVKGASIRPLDFAAAFLRKLCVEMEDVPRGAIRVEVKGIKDGKPTRVIYSSPGTMKEGTGIPVSIGAQMLAKGMIKEKGVFPPEGCVEPFEFLSKVAMRGIGEELIIKIISE